MKAMILAAGLGTRLKHLTQSTPKCLMQAGGKTMLEHAVLRLKRAGVDFAVVNTHYHAQQVQHFVESQANFGINVLLSYEPQLLGTGGGLKNVQAHFQDADPFIVVNADVYCEIDLGDVIGAHRAKNALATLVVMNREESSYLLFDNASGRLIGWSKASDKDAPSHAGAVPKAFCGIQVLSPRVFNFMASTSKSFSIIDSYLAAAQAGESIYPFELKNQYWIDIGTPKQLQALQHRLS